MAPPAEAVPAVDGLAKPEVPDGAVAAELGVEVVEPAEVEPVEVDPVEVWACAGRGTATDARRTAMRTGVM